MRSLPFDVVDPRRSRARAADATVLPGARRPMAFERMRIFTGNANPKLAEAVCRHLNISLGRAVVGRFSDGEVMVELLENVRGRDVFVLQSTCAPTNDNLMELLVMVDALKRASAARITAAIPYFGYARQDRRPRSARVPITAKVVANMLDDGRRRPRADDGPARRPDPGLLQHPGRQHLRDAGAARRPVEAATTTTCSSCRPTSAAWCARARSPSGSTRDLAIIDKRRPKANVAEVMNIIGDVEGPHLRDHGRHRRHRRHAVQGGRRR